MADVNVIGTPETIVISENPAGVKYALEYTEISVVDSTSVANLASTAPTFSIKASRGGKSAMVQLITEDWDFSNFRKFNLNGIELKGLILIPGSGGPDTFSIKDGSDTGPYLYKGAVSASTVVIYPSALCRPYIDFSECTLSAGHAVTFLW